MRSAGSWCRAGAGAGGWELTASCRRRASAGCHAAESVRIRQASWECLACIASGYYDKLPAYMQVRAEAVGLALAALLRCRAAGWRMCCAVLFVSGEQMWSAGRACLGGNCCLAAAVEAVRALPLSAALRRAAATPCRTFSA